MGYTPTIDQKRIRLAVSMQLKWGAHAPSRVPTGAPPVGTNV